MIRNTMRFLIPLVAAWGVIAPSTSNADWPDFRGPHGNGHVVSEPGAKQPRLPQHWSETENVRWKTPIPYRGHSSPVEMGGQIWLTTATEDGHDFFAICVDAETGRMLFNERVFHCDDPESLGNDLNSYASPSPVIEPGRVYVHFGSYGTACLNTKNFKVLWKRDDLPCRHFRGPGSSPVLYRNLLILTMDGVDVQYVTALDKATGETVWKTDRTADWNDLGPDGKPAGGGDFRKAYSTPLLIEANGSPVMLSVGSKAAYAYDPRDGKELWKVRHEGFSGATRPVFGNGLAYISSGNGKQVMMAIRVDGRGDVTDTHIVWQVTRSVPRMVSPILADGLLFMITDNGIGMCRNALSGEEVWQERIGGEFAASPIYSDGLIYTFNRTGKTKIIRSGRTYEVVAENELDEGIYASPAVLGNALILRTVGHLYSIEGESVLPSSSE